MEEIAPDLWLLEGEIVNFYGFAYPTRSVIVRLPNGGLWVWSPVALSDEIATALDRLGKVSHLVSPNKIHHLYLQDWKQRWPEAKIWGPQSSIDKRPDLNFEAPLTDSAPDDWGGAIDVLRFTGSPAMDELVFFHHGSRTAILADLSENFGDDFLQRHWSWWQRLLVPLWGIGVGRGHAPLEWRLSWFRKSAARKALDRLLSFDPVGVIMAHGEWQKSGGKDFLLRSFSWLK